MDYILPKDLKLVTYPDPILHKLCNNVYDDFPVEQVAETMFEIMDSNKGMGLACPQVGLRLRMFVCEIEINGTKERTVCINPVLKNFSKAKERRVESCLSLPGISGNVSRSMSVSLEAWDVNWTMFSMEAEGVSARCLQHEYDHINGILITQKFSGTDKGDSKKILKKSRY